MAREPGEGPPFVNLSDPVGAVVGGNSSRKRMPRLLALGLEPLLEGVKWRC
jgi:hypothetical protein